MMNRHRTALTQQRATMFPRAAAGHELELPDQSLARGAAVRFDLIEHRLLARGDHVPADRKRLRAILQRLYQERSRFGACAGSSAIAREINHVRFRNEGCEIGGRRPRDMLDRRLLRQRRLARKSAALEQRDASKKRNAEARSNLVVPVHARVGDCSANSITGDAVPISAAQAKRRRARQPAATMRQPIENVRRQVIPETFCSPANRARSCAGTSRMFAPSIAAPICASIVQPNVISRSASVSYKSRLISRSGPRSVKNWPLNRPHQSPSPKFASTCGKVIVRQLLRSAVRAPRTMA